MGVDGCFYHAAVKVQFSFNAGLDMLLFLPFSFSSLHSDVLDGSHYICYPGPELIWQHELVGVLPDLVSFFSLAWTFWIVVGDYDFI